MYLFPALAAFALAASSSPRNALLFMWSVSFQTNVVGWLGLVLPWPRARGCFQAAGFCYLATVALVWFTVFGGAGTSFYERVFNILIHYVTFVVVAVDSVRFPAPWPPQWTLYVYPAVYYLQMPLMNAWAGWSIYPLSDRECALVGITFFFIVRCAYAFKGA